MAVTATRPAALELVGQRNDAFRKAEKKTGVPRELLMAIAYQQGRFEKANAPDAFEKLASAEPEEQGDEHAQAHRFGMMYLSLEQVALAASLTKLSETSIREEVEANVVAAATLISAAGKPMKSDADWETLAPFETAITSYHELAESPIAAALARRELNVLLHRGFDLVAADGERLSVIGFGEPLNFVTRALGVGEYPAIQQVPASSSNYGSRGGNPIRYVVIHDMEGFMSGAIGTFQNPARQSSAHYLTRASDGHIVQMVPESLNAWHCGNGWYNRNSIGIEHEGFAGRPNGGGYYNETQYQASANLVAAIAVRYGIPIDRGHIFGHGNVPSSGTGGICSDAQANGAQCGGSAHHWDPGPTWNWGHYLDLVAQAMNQAPVAPPVAPGCGALASGASLARGQSLTSCGGKATLVHQGDGNVVVYDTANARALWSTGTNGQSTSTFAMQGDSNLVLYGNGPLWSSGTSGQSGAILVMQDDGNLVIYGGGMRPLWSTGTQVSAPPPAEPPAPPPPPPPPPAPPAAPTVGCGTLATGAALGRGQSVTSCGGRFTLVHQGDGNVVLYDGGVAIWHTHTNGRATTTFVMQGDGNLVLYNGGTALWNSGTSGHSGATLAVQDDGNAVIYAGGRAWWVSGTVR